MSAAPRCLPWRALMQAGLGRLRLPPEVFWAMTPGEFAAALGAEASPAAMGRSGLARLMALYPDRPCGDDPIETGDTP